MRYGSMKMVKKGTGSGMTVDNGYRLCALGDLNEWVEIV